MIHNLSENDGRRSFAENIIDAHEILEGGLAVLSLRHDPEEFGIEERRNFYGILRCFVASVADY